MFGLGRLMPEIFRPRVPALSTLEDWDELKTPFKETLYIRGSTWKPFTLYSEKRVFGDWTYEEKAYPKNTSMSTFQGVRRGNVFFDTDVLIPRLLCSGGGGWTDCVWMSYTPMEVFTQRRGLKMSKGKVFIGGLGMGWLANRVAARKQVTEVRVAEIEADVIKLATPACTSPKLHVVKGNAWEEARKLDDSWTFLFDIWPAYGNNDEDYDLRKFRKERPNAKTWAWGGVATPDGREW